MEPVESKTDAAVSQAFAAYESSKRDLAAAENRARSIQDKIDEQDLIERGLRSKIMDGDDETIGESTQLELKELAAVRFGLRRLRQSLKDAQSDILKLAGATQALSDDVYIARGQLNCVDSTTLRRRGIRDPVTPEVRRHYVR